ncbi:tetratricopeptide repeat protein [Bosea beijingensis]
MSRWVEYHGLRLSRSFAFGIGLAALTLAAGLETPAFAAGANLRGEAMPAGFGRLSLTFDEPIQTRIRVSNGVLIVAFGSQVQVDVARIARELPNYVSVARVDPDGRGMRFALTQSYKANLIEAGDKAFIDLLPQNWSGVMPGPPPEALAELTERLRLAEVRAKDAARQPPAPPATLTMSSASLPTLERLIFKAPAETKLASNLSDGTLKLVFDRPMNVEAAAIRNALPTDIDLTGLDAGKEALSLTLSLPKDWQVRSFDDETGLVVDLLRPVKQEAPSLVELSKPPAPTPPAPAATPPTEPAPKSAATAPAAQPATPPTQAVAAAPTAPEVPPGPVAITVDGKRLDFRFTRPTGAAAFLDAGVMTLVFDTRDTIDPAKLAGLMPKLIEDSTVTREGKVTLVRLRLAGQPLARVFDNGPTWSLDLGEDAGRPATPVEPQRSMDERGQTIVAVPLAGLTGIHWLETGPAGLPVAVATATGPTRLTPKPYQFVEFGLLPTAQGLAVQPHADDVAVRAGTEQVRIGRSGGLNVSLDIGAPLPKPEEKARKQEAAPLLDGDAWARLRLDNPRERARALMLDITDASRGRKSEARLALARFYAANGLMPEAAGPLNALLADDKAMRGNREALFLRGVIATGMHRHQQALAAFDAGPIKDDVEAGLWRALVEERLNRNAQALVGFRRAESVLDRYPLHLQGEFREAMARTALAQQDIAVAERQIQALADMPRGSFDQEHLALLQARLDDISGRPEAAMNGYKPLFEAKSRPVAAEAQLRAVKLADAEKRTDIKPEEAIARLETVSVIWRGGRLEIEALAGLGRLYADQQRWRDAFMVARRANENFTEDPLTSRMHDETAQRFAELFSGSGLGKLPRIETLALFYDFKEFLPIGRRGDEITRLLADRLVELDLLDQASEILKYQMDRRLSGAARSTVAARLAMIDLMNGKPADAVRALNTTRLVELPADVKRARLLLEAKALSDLSRTDQALEMLEVERGPEIDRLRADIYWTGRRWREAGEAYERLLGESWRGDGALGDSERADVMRAGVSYVMASENLSLDRLRSKFAPKMARGADARTFAFITGADRTRAADIREMARATANADTLSDFLKAYRERYPAYSAAMRKPQAPAADKLPSPAEGAAAEPAAPPSRS